MARVLELDRPVAYYGQPVAKVDNRTLKAAAKRAGVSDWKKFTRYTFRHYMATRVRRVPGVTVAREERAKWMGHTDPEHRTTEHWYESQDADYLENVRQAIDGVFTAIATLTETALFAPGSVPGTRLTVIKKDDPFKRLGEQSA